ncbi:MAG: zinc ribbon domain-containing protein [Methylococcales bacterium]
MKLTKAEIANLTHDDLIAHIGSSLEYESAYKEISQALKDELVSREPTANYQCPKCECNKYNESQVRTAGGGFSAFFDIQTEKYRVITCTRCNYSELYKSDVGIGRQVMDGLFGG